MQRIDHPDAAAANAQALHDLENGANGLDAGVCRRSNGAHGFGLDPTAEALERVLDGVFIDAGIAIELNPVLGRDGWPRFTSPSSSNPAASIPRPVDIRFGFDPIGACAVWGSQPRRGPKSRRAVTGAIKGLAADGI